MLEGLGTALSAEPSAARRRATPTRRRAARRRRSRSTTPTTTSARPSARRRRSTRRSSAREPEQRPRAADRRRRAAPPPASRATRSSSRTSSSNFNTTMAALAVRGAATCAPSIRELPADARRPPTRAFASLNAAFPPTRAFAREILPGVRETPATIDAAFPWIDAGARADVAGRAAGPRRRPRAARRATSRELTDASLDAAAADRPRLASARADVLLPTGDVVIRDEFQTGRENYKEFFYAMVGLAGEGQNFDGNGMYVRFQTGGGAQHGLARRGQPRQPAAVRRRCRRRRSATGPPTRAASRRSTTGQPCYKQQLPDLNGPAGRARPRRCRTPDAPATAGRSRSCARAAAVRRRERRRRR